MASKKGTPLEIATQGFSSPEALGITTQGFIEPILGDIITGGEAGVIYVIGYIVTDGGVVTGGTGNVNLVWCYSPDGGLTTGGAGTGISQTWCWTTSGGLTLGGAAGISTSVTPSVGGDIVSGGAGNINLTWCPTVSGGLTSGGTGNINLAWCPTVDGGMNTGGEAGIVTGVDLEYTGSGGVTIGGEADVVFVLGITISRGGVFHRGRVGIKFEYAEYQKEQTPMDYWKKIEDAIEKAKQREAKLFKYTGDGKLLTNLDGRAKLVIVHHDLPDSEVIVHTNHEINDKIKLEISRLFNNDVTADEIIALDDEFVLNDLLNRGDYEIKTGENSRYRYRGKDKGAGGEAGVSFQPAGAKVDHFDRKADQIRREDEALVLGESDQQRLSREEEELEILGLLD